LAIRTLQIARIVVLVALVPLQTANLWAPQPGWQVLQDSIGRDDVLAVGLFGEYYVDANGFVHPPSGISPRPPTTSPRPPSGSAQRSDPRRVDTANMPGLMLRCVNGVTELLLVRPTFDRDALRTPIGSPRATMRGTTAEAEGRLVLDFGDSEPIEVALRGYRRSDPVWLPDPIDTIGRLRRSQFLYYYDIEPGDAVAFDFTGGLGAPAPDAVFPLEGLDDLLRAHRDPCRWRSS